VEEIFHILAERLSCGNGAVKLEWQQEQATFSPVATSVLFGLNGLTVAKTGSS